MATPEAGTTELDHSYLETVTIQGREFQSYSINHRIYFGPVDDDEAERLELQQRVFNKVFDDRLIFPPVSQPKKVLDCGYGSGAWAVEVAEEYPGCEVIGIDISPHMKPDETPENLWLQESTFLGGQATFGIFRGEELQLTDLVLKRGGWIQAVELYPNVQSDNGTIEDEHALRQWSLKYRRGLEDLKDIRVGTRLGQLLSSAGFVQVETKMIPLPLSAWSNDPRMRDIGAINRDNVHSFLSSMALYPFTQRLHMSREELEVLLARARQEADNPSLKAYFPL
ncbi:hypothetical protein FQN54_002995 [Arachnomyces sp. PD_36]|nr:hypothetical protein FQN54_002995 [Arachnomyces sp. PD_36]